MSRILPDPQIVQLRAMRAGDIAVATAGAAATVNVVPMAFAQPITDKSITVPSTTFANVALAGTPSETTTPVGSSFATVTSRNSDITVDVNGTASFPLIFNELVTLDGTPSQSPLVTVGTGTSVV